MMSQFMCDIKVAGFMGLPTIKATLTETPLNYSSQFQTNLQSVSLQLNQKAVHFEPRTQ